MGTLKFRAISLTYHFQFHRGRVGGTQNDTAMTIWIGGGDRLNDQYCSEWEGSLERGQI